MAGHTYANRAETAALSQRECWRAREIAKHMLHEVVLTYHRGKWEWRVCDRSGKAIFQGVESTRAEAKYKGARGLFLLLMRGWRY
jgi:hypothetical protein